MPHLIRLAIVLGSTVVVWACSAPPNTEPSPSDKTDSAKNPSDDAPPTKSAPAPAPAAPPTPAPKDDLAGEGDSEDACYAACEAKDPVAAPIIEELAGKMYDCICGAAVCGKECGATEWCKEGGTKLSDDGTDACSVCWSGQGAEKCTQDFNTACNKQPDCVRGAPCFWACAGLDATGH